MRDPKFDIFMDDVRLDSLESATPITIDWVNNSEGYRCGICNGFIGKNAKVFSVWQSNPHIDAYVHRKCLEIKMVTLKLTGK